MKFATKHIRHYHLTLGMLLHYLGKLKIKFSADAEKRQKMYFCIFNWL